MASENHRSSHKLLFPEFPKNGNNNGKNDNYLSIKKALESKELNTEIAFLISTMPIIDDFIKKFQREEALKHLSYPNCEKVLKTTMARLMKSKVYTEKKRKYLKK